MPEVVHIIVCHHDPTARRQVGVAAARAGWRLTEAGSAAACLAALAADPDAVVLADDAALLGGRPLDVPLLVLGPEDVGAATAACRGGAWDYVVRRDPDALADAVRRAVGRRRTIRERPLGDVEGLAHAFRGAVDGIALVEPDGRLAFVNRALADALGASEAALVGRRLSELLRVAGDDAALDDIVAAVAQQGRWRGALERPGGGAPPRVWDVSFGPLAGHDAARARVVGIFRDVSEQRALEQLRADFLSMVTHDIKVPLTVILGYAEMLGDPEPPPAEIPRDVVSRIREAGEQIQALVANFLDLSRIEAGRFTVDPRPFDLTAMLAHALEQQAHAARRKEIALALQVDGPLPVVADEGQLERVVANLVANALKYTPAGGRVEVIAHRHGCDVLLAVDDTGRGIPAADLPHLFERYRRVRETKRTEGTGLGLFIAKTIVDAHHGRIRVESTPGIGSRFTVVIPG